MWNKVSRFIPPVLMIPVALGSLLYLIFLPESAYFLFGIYFDLWFPVLKGIWGYPVFFVILMVPYVNAILLLLLSLQSFHVLVKFILGTYDPSFHGFVTMYPAVTIVATAVFSALFVLFKEKEVGDMGFFNNSEDASDRLLEDKLYEKVARELKADKRLEGVWTKARAKSNGDLDKAESLYIEFRIQTLKDEASVAKDKALDRQWERQMEQERIEKRQKTVREGYIILAIVLFIVIANVIPSISNIWN